MMGNKKLKRVLGRALSAFLVMTLTFEGAFVTSGATEALEASETEETLTSEASEAVSDDLVVDDSETVINVDSLPKNDEKKVICKDKTVEITLGENASYEKEELDELFKAVFDDEDAFDTDSLKVEYSFFTGDSSVYDRAFDYLKERLSGSADEEDASGLEDELFDSLMDAESEKLSEIEAGSDVLAVIKATDSEDKTVLYLVKAKVTSDAANEESSEDEGALDASSEASSEDAATTDDSASDGSSLEEDSEEEVAGFTIKASDIMYGESGDNKDGYLDALFAPSYVIDGEKAESFETEYKFVTDKENIGEITAETFDDIEGVSLETIPAGTEVMAVCKATIEDQPDAVAVDTFTVEKRKLRLCFEAPKESAINEKSELLDDKLVIEKDEAAGCVTVEVLESELSPEGVSTFAATEDEIDPAKVLGSDVVLDVSEVDYENIGYQEVPVTMELSENMSENFEIVEELVGYVYVEETTYTITFTAMNNGETKELKYELDQSFLSEGKTVKEVLDRLGVYSDVYPSMGGFVDASKGEEIARWMIAKDAMSTSYSGDRLPADFIDDEADEGNYLIFDKSDYYVSAFIRKKASDNIYVEVNPTVVYNGMSHVSQFASRNTKQENDLDLTVSYHADEDLPGYELYLRYGKDYKVTYKNNKNASVTMSESGEYEPLYVAGTDDAKRPCAMVTGIGSYKGFSATVYFDILPSNIGADTVAEVSGLKKSYVLNSKGKISAKISPKVTLSKWYYYKKSVKKVQTLKFGKDYVPKLYVYEEGIWKECADSNPSRITQEGRYLYTVRGIGNYCGTAFGQGWSDEPFNDGRSGEIFPAVCSYVGTDVAKCQFIVIGDASQDLANATVTVKKTQLKYKHKKYYTGADFGIKVTIGKGADKRVLTEGQDYYVTYDGNDFKYIN
ncbi:MAG: hypothetical protein K6G10_09320, partial [Butyrivibrio sp.]|nr:hypothetical protein [Butyrivibrio sp.]